MQKPCLTSLPHSNSYQPYPNDKLRNGNSRKPNRDRNISHCHGVYPVTRILVLNSEPLKNKGVPNLRVNTICATSVQTTNAGMPYHGNLLHLFLGNIREWMIPADF